MFYKRYSDLGKTAPVLTVSVIQSINISPHRTCTCDQYLLTWDISTLVVVVIYIFLP